MTEVLDSAEAGPTAIRGGVVRVAGYAGGVLLSVGSAALLFRHLGVAEAGRYVLVLSVVTIAVGITEAGLSALGVREVAQRHPAEVLAMLRNLLGLRLVLSTAGIGVACAYMAAAGYGGRLVAGTALTGVAMLLQGVQVVLTVGLQVRLRFGAVTLVELIRQAVNVAAIAVLVLAGASLLPFFGALIVAAAAGLAGCVLLLGGSAPLRPAFDGAQWVALLKLTLPFAFATAVAVVYLRVGLLVLDRLTDARQTGLYALSFRVVEVTGQVPGLLAGAAFPIFARAARDDAARLRYGVQRVFDSSLMLGALIAVGCVAGAPAIIAVIGGAQFHDADAVLRWHGLALCGMFASQPFGFALLASGRTRAVLATTLVGLVVAVGATIPLADAYGARGAAAAAAAAEWALAVTGALLLARRGGPRVRLGTARKVVVAGALALTPLLVLPSLPAAVLGVLLFCGALLALGALPRELLLAFRPAATPTGSPPRAPRR